MIQQEQFPFSSETKSEGGVSILGTLLLIGFIAITFAFVNKMAIKDANEKNNRVNY
jgi:hypothetical protein